MARPRTIVTKAELAGILGLSKARISQLYQREDFPVRPDGRVNRDEAVRWYKDVGLADRIKRGPKSKVASISTQPTSVAAPKDSAAEFLADHVHAARVMALEEIATPAEALRFARVARRIGVTPEQAYALALWYACQPCLTLDDIEAEELDSFTEPTREQWVEVLGAIDFKVAEALHDRATASETTPEAA